MGDMRMTYKNLGLKDKGKSLCGIDDKIIKEMRISGSHSCGYEEFCLLTCNAM
jgi:hypothetical protein